MKVDLDRLWDLIKNDKYYSKEKKEEVLNAIKEIETACCLFHKDSIIQYGNENSHFKD